MENKSLEYTVRGKIKESNIYITDYKEDGNYKLHARITTELTFEIGNGIFKKEISNTFSIIDGDFVRELINK